VAERFAFARGAATGADILADPAVSAVIVATRHDRHGDIALESLRAGKATFVEKPLCLAQSELAAIAEAATAPGAPPLVVGFNRRHAPLLVSLKAHLDGARGPLNTLIRVNAGVLPADHWLNDPVEGGGRLLGEGCHFLDLLCHLTGSEPVAVVASGHAGEGEPLQSAQDVAVTVRFADGSLGTLLYGTAGAAAAGKELVEAHRGDRSGRLDDFGSLELWGGGKARTESSRARDKGHAAEVAHFARLARGEEPASLAETASYLAAMRVTFAAVEALATGAEVRLDG
jgi:predicted dehydrogenase